MLEPKLKVAVDYEKCHPERCDKGVCAAVMECPAKLWKQTGWVDRAPSLTL